MKHEAIARTPIAGPQWNNYFELILAWHACRAKPLRAKESFLLFLMGCSRESTFRANQTDIILKMVGVP